MKIKSYLQESPVFALNSAYEAIISHINKILKNEEVNLLQGLVLTAIFFEGTKLLNPSSLAEQLKTSRGNMSHIISHLEYRGLVKRVLNTEDARQFHIELRPTGRKKALTLIKYFDQLQHCFEKELGVKNCQQISLGINSLPTAYLKNYK